MTHPLLEAIEKLNHGIDLFVEAKNAIQEAAAELEALRVARLPDGMEIDWEEPDKLWINGFSCLRPTDEFAAVVGRNVIRKAMQAFPEAATFRVRAS